MQSICVNKSVITLEPQVCAWRGNVLSRLGKLLLTGTAISPVLFTYALSLFLDGESAGALLLAAVGAALFCICNWFIQYAKTNLERSSFSASTVEVADRENMVFLILYLLPLFTGQFVAPPWQVWILVIAIFAMVVATGYNYHFNPLLGIMGWHFYKVGTKEGITYVLVTKKRLRTAATMIEVGQLTEYIVLDLEGK